MFKERVYDRIKKTLYKARSAMLFSTVTSLIMPLRSPSDRMYKICHSPKSISLLWKDNKSLIYILHDIMMAISEEKNKFLFRRQHANQIQSLLA